MGNTDSIWGVVGIIVFLCGIFAIYSAIKMKTSGDINASLLLGKDYMYKTCKNKEAYIRKQGRLLLYSRFVAAVYGAIDIVHCFVYPMGIIDRAGIGCVFYSSGMVCGIYVKTEKTVFLAVSEERKHSTINKNFVKFIFIAHKMQDLSLNPAFFERKNR